MKIYFTSFFLLLFTLNGFGQAALSGKVTDAETGEPILFGDVVLYKDGKLITGEQTDFDGNYAIGPIEPGKYTVVFKYVGYADVKKEKVKVRRNKETVLDASLDAGITLDNPIKIRRGCYHPLIEPDKKTEKEKSTEKNSTSKEENANISTTNQNEKTFSEKVDSSSQIKIRGFRQNTTYPYNIGVPIRNQKKEKEVSNNNFDKGNE